MFSKTVFNSVGSKRRTVVLRAIWTKVLQPAAAAAFQIFEYYEVANYVLPGFSFVHFLDYAQLKKIAENLIFWPKI